MYSQEQGTATTGKKAAGQQNMDGDDKEFKDENEKDDGDDVERVFLKGAMRPRLTMCDVYFLAAPRPRPPPRA
jgi:hypothetical protein